MKKGAKIRTIRQVKAYMRGQGDRVVCYPDFEVRTYRVEAFYRKRNRVKVRPLADSPGIAYGGVIDRSRFPVVSDVFREFREK